MEERDIVERIRENVIQGRVHAEDEGFDEGFEGQPGTVELIEDAVQRGVDARAVVLDGLTAGMDVVGGRFERGTYLIPDMLASAEAVGAAMEVLAPHLEKAGMESKGTFVIATVSGDLHDIGKNIVATMVKGAGYDVVDLGTDVSTEHIVDAVRKHRPRFLGLSALLTTTMREMKNVVTALQDEDLRQDVMVLIGGAPTSRDFAEKIGADAYCADAFRAVEYTKDATRAKG